MAQPGDVLEDPISGQLVFRQTASSTQGELLEMEVTYLPQGTPPPEHYHPMQEERFEIVSGSLQVRIGENTRTYQAGEQFIVPKGVSHAMHNPGNSETAVIWQVRPALDTETMFETLRGLANDGKTSANGVPNLLQLAVILHTFNREFRPSKPSYTILGPLFSILAPIGRLLGYKARYPQYSD